MLNGKKIWDMLSSGEGSISTLSQGAFGAEIKEKSQTLRIRYLKITEMAIRLEYIRLKSSSSFSPITDTNQLLKQQAEHIIDKVTYLLEDFTIVENDTLNHKIQLRSYAPMISGRDKHFFEIILENGNDLSFERLYYNGKSERIQKIPSDMTTEVFCRLLDDLLLLPNFSPTR